MFLVHEVFLAPSYSIKYSSLEMCAKALFVKAGLPRELRRLGNRDIPKLHFLEKNNISKMVVNLSGAWDLDDFRKFAFLPTPPGPDFFKICQKIPLAPPSAAPPGRFAPWGEGFFEIFQKISPWGRGEEGQFPKILQIPSS